MTLLVSHDAYLAPNHYAGLHALHRYWGKKPPETVGFLIEQLSRPGGLVFDPFVGSGAVAREACLRGRRVIAGDLNPLAVELTSQLLCPPTAAEVASALATLAGVQRHIQALYALEDGHTATHFLWQGDTLDEVWFAEPGRRARTERLATHFDRAQASRLEGYRVKDLRPLRLFDNSRINARAGMDWPDLFTGRALRGIELLREAIAQVEPRAARRALQLCLTAAVGQMSKMVFAIDRRGKAGGRVRAPRREVGSWVIGLWTPHVRFEVNVWNCFHNRVRRLQRALSEPQPPARPLADAIELVLRGEDGAHVVCEGALQLTSRLPAESVDLVLTDPPHGDRIPYLELSEMWNAVLGHEVRFEDELVVSNAKPRGKSLAAYLRQLRGAFRELSRVLAPGGVVALMFNSRSTAEWSGLLSALAQVGLRYRGRLPMAYSARSVVQDTRPGAMAHDYVLLLSHATVPWPEAIEATAALPGFEPAPAGAPQASPT